MNKKTNRFFNAAKQGDTLTLSVYDAIGADSFGEGITASMVADALKGDYKNVTVRINSPGGDAFEGVAIYNLLKSCGMPVNVIVDGLDASAASIISMAGDTITMNEGSVMMIHEAQAFSIGDADGMRKMADTLDTVTQSIADIYVGRTGLSKNKVLAMMKEETWMDPAECVKNGFASVVGKGEKITNSFDLSVFKNTPAEFQAAAKTEEVVIEVSDKKDDAEDYRISLFQKRLELEKRK